MNAAAAPRNLFAQLAFGSIVAAIAASFLLSGMSLSWLGYNYDSAGGAAWQKFHPASFLALFAIAVNTIRQPRPARYVLSRFVKFPGIAYFLSIWIFFAIFAVGVQSSPVSQLIDPYLVPIILLLMLDEFSDKERDAVRVLLHAILLVNAFVAIVEYALHWRLFPYVISGEAMTGDPRSTALMGHPLINAAATGAYALCLFLGGDRKIKPLSRVAFFALSALSLGVFGGRTAIAALGLITAFKLIADFLYVLLGARFHLNNLLGGLLLLPVFIFGAFLGFYLGAFDVALDRFSDDNGSSAARVLMMQLFDMFDPGDLLLGPPQDVLGSKMNSIGISVGIENTWIALIFYYGIWMAGFFIISLFVFFWEFWRKTRNGGSLMFIYFLIVISSALGLATKTFTFVQFSILLIFMLDPRDASAPDPASLGRFKWNRNALHVSSYS